MSLAPPACGQPVPATSARLHWLLPGMAAVPVHDDWLSPREAAWVAGLRFPRRRREVRLGRWTAKTTLALYFGRGRSAEELRAVEIDRARDGAPAPFVEGRPRPP